MMQKKTKQKDTDLSKKEDFIEETVRKSQFNAANEFEYKKLGR